MTITKKKLTPKEKAEKVQKRKERWENFKKFFSEASCWIGHILSFVFLVMSYMSLPAIMNVLSQGGWAVLAGIFLIPIALAIGAGTVMLVLADVIKSAISKKWYHIVLSLIMLGLLLV